MIKEELKTELLERYKATGRVGLTKPRSIYEALSLIETMVSLYEEEPQEIVLSVKDMTKKLREFLNSF